MAYNYDGLKKRYEDIRAIIISTIFTQEVLPVLKKYKLRLFFGMGSVDFVKKDDNYLDNEVTNKLRETLDDLASKFYLHQNNYYNGTWWIVSEADIPDEYIKEVK